MEIPKYVDWESNSDLISTLALEARGGDEGCLNLLLTSSRIQPKFVSHAHIKSRRSRVITEDDFLQLLILLTWQAAVSTASVRWDEDEGVPFSNWVLKVWNQNMDRELIAETRTRRSPEGSVVSFEDFEEVIGVMDAVYPRAHFQPDILLNISKELFLEVVEEEFGIEVREICQMLSDGLTKADVAAEIYPSETYYKRWMRINLLCKKLRPLATEAGFIK